MPGTGLTLAIMATTAAGAALTEVEIAKWDKHIKQNLHRGAVSTEGPAVAQRRPKEPQPAYLFTDWWQGPEREVDAGIADTATVDALSEPCYWDQEECDVPELRSEFLIDMEIAMAESPDEVPCLTTLDGCSLEDQVPGLPRGGLESIARDPPCWWEEEAVSVA